MENTQLQLKDFVAQSLIEIIEGVSEAQVRAKQHRAIINPAIETASGAAAYYKNYDSPEEELYRIQMFDFDMAITLSTSKEAKGIIVVVSGILTGGAQGSTTGETSELSRIKFSVPVVLPPQR